MIVMTMLDWIADLISQMRGSGPPPPEPELDRYERRAVSHQARESIERANRAVDTWNERTRDTWRADGAR